MFFPVQLLFFFSILFLLTILSAPFLYKFNSFPIKDGSPIEFHGNFLHITDIHPDPFYTPNATAISRCHNSISETKKPDHMKKGISGPWGAPATICDTPINLVDATFEWLKENWKNKIDFVIWTGDNARHNHDDVKPRPLDEIFSSNRRIANKFLETFGRFTPIIPSIGNNDVHPNNIIFSGPNDIFKTFYNIWSPFIPRNQRKTFLKGGYFYTEVIPNKLMVISLNTLYFFKANTAVNGCREENQPGTKQIKWLKHVLKKARKQNMKVYLTGHVAPRSKQYTRSCYKSYGRLALKYHDIILGHYYGHSNMDHFFFISNRSVRKRPKIFMNENYGKDSCTDNDDDDESYNEEEKEDDNVDVDYDDDDDDDTISDLEEQMSFGVSHKSQDDEVEANVSDFDKYMKKLLKHYDRIIPRSRVSEKNYAVIHINPSIIPTFFPALRIFKYSVPEVTKGDEIDNDSTKKKNGIDSLNNSLIPLGYTQYFINLTEANFYPNVTPKFEIEYTTWDDYYMKDLSVSSWIKLTKKILNRQFYGSLWEKVQENLMVGTRSLVRQKRKKKYEF